MVNIKEKIRELCKNHVEDSVVKSFLNRYSSTYLYDDFVKDTFAEHDSNDLNYNYTISMFKWEDEITYKLLDYSKTNDNNGQSEELNSFVIKNSNPNPTNIFFG